MLSKTYTVTFQGIEIFPVPVEIVVTSGLPNFTIVGLADRAVTESRERIRGCFHTLGVAFPPKRITVNLSPADLPKEGAHFDLPIALGLMGALDVFETLQLEEYIALGELGMDGLIHPYVGILPTALYALEVDKGLICPQKSSVEAIWAGLQKILPASNLMEIVNHFKGQQMITTPSLQGPVDQWNFDIDMEEVKGQLIARRGLEIAAVGGHNVLMSGPPGSGKSMLAKRFATILPPLSAKEALEVSVVHSLAGLLPDEGFLTKRAYRDPHHSISMPAMVGGGTKVKPGEISLAHHGVLFLDELPEFSRAALEALRQPIETGEVLIARANNHVVYPAKFQLIAAMNPCKCGYLGERSRECRRAPLCGKEYQSKLSGPLLDRFDLFIFLKKIDPKDLVLTTDTPYLKGESSKQMRERILTAIAFQEKRNQTIKNCDLSADELRMHVETSKEMDQLIQKAFEKFKLSARGFYRTLRIARSIADLDCHEKILQTHLLEALQFRDQL